MTHTAGKTLGIPSVAEPFWETSWKKRHLGFCLFEYSFGKIPGSLDGKESAFNAGDLGLIPGLGRSPGEGNGNLLQSSFQTAEGYSNETSVNAREA